MKKTILLTICLICALHCAAQHFTFNGISMLNSLDDFKKSLQEKRCYATYEEDTCFWVSGTYLEQSPQYFRVFGDQQSVNKIVLGYSFAQNGDAESFKKSTIKQLSDMYTFLKKKTDKKSVVWDGETGRITVVAEKINDDMDLHNRYSDSDKYVVHITFETEFPAHYLSYKLTEQGIFITKSPNSDKENIVIPSKITINDEPLDVVGVDDQAFMQYGNLTTLTIEDGVQILGENSFAWCGKLSTVNLGEGLAEIKDGAFYGTDSLRSVTLPSTLQKFGQEIFWNCHNLEAILVREGSPYMKSDGCVLYSYSGDTLICMPQAYRGSYHVPDGVRHLAPWSMVADSLKSVTLPDGLLTIGEHAFMWDTKLASVNLPKTLLFIGEGAFVQCHSLREAIVPEGVTELSKSTFYECKSLSTLSLPSTLKIIGDDAFYNCCQLETLALPESLKFIGASSFEHCKSIKTYSIPTINPLYSSKDGILMNKKEDAIIAFPAARTGSYIIPEGVSTIEKYAFDYCSLKKITLPHTLREIKDNAFAFCRDLREIYVPEGVEKIGDDAFNYSHIEAIHLPTTLVQIGRRICGNQAVVYAPEDKLAKYRILIESNLSYSYYDNTTPTMKPEAEYKPNDAITFKDCVGKLLGVVQIEKNMWDYTFKQLKAKLPASMPVDEPKLSGNNFVLKLDKNMDIAIKSDKYKLYYIRVHAYSEEYAEFQEFSIATGNDSDTVYKTLIKQAPALKPKFGNVAYAKVTDKAAKLTSQDSKTIMYIMNTGDQVIVVVADAKSKKLDEIAKYFE